MRSIWKGHIRFSLVTIPIRIYNAVDTEETIRFNQLHKEDNGAVGYEKKCKKCGKSLTTEEPTEEPVGTVGVSAITMNLSLTRQTRAPPAPGARWTRRSDRPRRFAAA